MTEVGSLRVVRAYSLYSLRIICLFILKFIFFAALDVLRDQTNSELWYLFAPVLVEDEPKDTLAAFRSMGKNLNPVRLLPALIAASNRNNVSKNLNISVAKGFKLYKITY